MFSNDQDADRLSAAARIGGDREDDNAEFGPTQQIHIETGPSGETACKKCGSQTATVRPHPSRLRLIFDFTLKLLLLLFGVALVTVLVRGAYLYAYDRGYADAQLRINDSYLPTYASLAEGGPCRRWENGYCAEAMDAKSAIQWSRHYLHLGDSESALERWDRALDFYRRSMNIGSSVGAQAAIYAAKRVQFQSMTCEYSDASLARIGRDFEKNPLGALIEMRQKQTALRALGYYNGKVDNKHGAQTRAAIRWFQSDLWFDETGALTAEQTVLLICGAAQIAKDVNSQNVLGIMYATGLGVRQNTDYALNWLEMAAQRGDADASWNLALLYGTRTVLSSVQICDTVQNSERADSYLAEAADAGHPAAEIAYRKFPYDTPEDRWRKLTGDLKLPEALERVGRGCNPNG
ncbi:MAG: tetratricopeptide repeat protein [Amphiplicatus sp.]